LKNVYISRSLVEIKKSSLEYTFKMFSYTERRFGELNHLSEKMITMASLTRDRVVVDQTLSTLHTTAKINKRSRTDFIDQSLLTKKQAFCLINYFNHNLLMKCLPSTVNPLLQKQFSNVMLSLLLVKNI